MKKSSLYYFLTLMLALIPASAVSQTNKSGIVPPPEVAKKIAQEQSQDYTTMPSVVPPSDVAKKIAREQSQDYTTIVNPQAKPVEASALDLVNKVYGAVDPELCKSDLISETRRQVNMEPQEDEGTLWLDGEDGYVVSYQGMTPDVSACAHFEGDSDNDKIADYSYFFLFPYRDNKQVEATEEQCRFCETLLKEMARSGMQLWNNLASTDLFEVVGNYNDKFVNLKLIDEAGDPKEGQYLLIMQVEPRAFTPADDETAFLKPVNIDEIGKEMRAEVQQKINISNLGNYAQNY